MTQGFGLANSGANDRGRLARELGILAMGLLLVACTGTGAAPSASVKASATTQAVTTPSPTVTAKASQAPKTSAPKHDFQLMKTCEGTECTVTKSSLSAIPRGTKISYSGPGMDSLTATVIVEGGSVTGTCNIATLPGTCKFTPGTGTLAKMPAEVVVTQAGPTWFWEGDLRP